MNPAISIVIPAFNADRFLPLAIQSILGQDFQNFELIVIVDDPSETIRQILHSFKTKDPRIHTFFRDREGISRARNFGIEVSCGKYLCWLDADDIALPMRLKIQFRFMEDHPEIGLAGSWIKKIDNGKSEIIRYPRQYQYILSRLLFENPFATSSIIIRKKIIEDLDLSFDPSFPVAEDYNFWVNVADKVKCANIPKVLTLYNCHGSNISLTRKNEMEKYAEMIQFRKIQQMGLSISEQQRVSHKSIINYSIPSNEKELDSMQNWLFVLSSHNKRMKYFPEPFFSEELVTRWVVIMMKRTGLSLNLLNQLLHFPLLWHLLLNPISSTHFILDLIRLKIKKSR